MRTGRRNPRFAFPWGRRALLPLVLALGACVSSDIPPDVSPYRQLAVKYLVAGRFQLSRQQLDLALKLNRDDEVSRFIDGMWYLVMTEVDAASGALVALTRTVHDERLRSRVETAIGLAQLLRADTDRAADHLRIALDLDPVNGAAQDLLQVATRLDQSAKPKVEDLAGSDLIRELVQGL